MKRHWSLFALGAFLLASPAWADYDCLAYFCRTTSSDKPGPFSLPVAYADGTPAAGEVLAFLYVVPEAGVNFAKTDPPPFTFASDGTVTPGEGVERVVWAALSTGESEGSEVSPTHGVVLGEDGLPVNGWFMEQMCICATNWPSSTGEQLPDRAYLYAVHFDTRAVDPVTGDVAVAAPVVSGDKGPAPLSAWGATFCASFPSTMGPGATIYLNLAPDWAGMVNGDVQLATAEQPVAPITELVVDGETLTDPDAIAAALAPAASGFAAAEDEEGDPVFTFTFSPARVPGLTTYTLWTSDRLDGGWMTFDALLQQKGLAQSGEVRYTKWRIQKEGSVAIPRLPDEDTRFYRLRGDIDVGTNESVKGE